MSVDVKPGTYQLFDNLTPEEFAELKADIKTRGVLVAVELDEDGNILDGHHRVRKNECAARNGFALIRLWEHEINTDPQYTSAAILGALDGKV